MPQNILITGANRGIGLQLTRDYIAQDDTQVFATYRTLSPALEELDIANANAHLVALDVTDGTQIVAAMDAVGAQTDKLDVLINNAGASVPRSEQALGTITAEAMHHLFEVNAVAPLMVTRAFLPLLRAAEAAKIVMISSQLGSMSWYKGGDIYAYTTSKAALNMISRGLAGDLGKEGMVVITTHPGWVQTDMGGQNAPLTVEESSAGLQKLIAGLTPDDNGGFFRWDGSVHPW